MNQSNYTETLQRHRLRATPVRRSILKLLSQAQRPLSAPEIVTTLPERPHKTTVYRDIEALTTAGICTPVDCGDGIGRFQLSGGKHRHYAICTQCKTITPVMLKPSVCAQERRVSKKTGFSINAHTMQFFGLCTSCQ